MATISYTESSQLSESLKKIDALRANILLSVISPKDELRFRWNTTIRRIFWLMALSNNPLSKGEINKILSDASFKNNKLPEKEVVVIKKAFDHINNNWLSTQKTVNLKSAVILQSIVSNEKLEIKAEDFRNSLAYFHTSKEHPVIQAGLIHYQIYALSQASLRNTRFASLISYLFLYKEGFDCRGMIIIDEYFRKNFTDYELKLKEAFKTGSQTAWLEFFSSSIINSLEKALEAINENRLKPSILTSLANLNERQKEILSILEKPDSSITNRQVQKIFKISQITASRDLTRLTSLLLVLKHGRGRSVYYTKV